MVQRPCRGKWLDSGFILEIKTTKFIRSHLHLPLPLCIARLKGHFITAHPHYLWILHLFARLSVTPKPIQRCSPGHCGHTQSHGNSCCLVWIFPVEVKQGATLTSCFSSHCKTGLLAFYFVLCFLNSCAFHWFHFLKCPLSVCWLVFLSIRRLWCALWRKCVLDKLHLDMN